MNPILQVFLLFLWMSFVSLAHSLFLPHEFWISSGPHLCPIITWHWVYSLKNFTHNHVIEDYICVYIPDPISAAQTSALSPYSYTNNIFRDSSLYTEFHFPLPYQIGSLPTQCNTIYATEQARKTADILWPSSSSPLSTYTIFNPWSIHVAPPFLLLICSLLYIIINARTTSVALK